MPAPRIFSPFAMGLEAGGDELQNILANQQLEQLQQQQAAEKRAQQAFQNSIESRKAGAEETTANADMYNATHKPEPRADNLTIEGMGDPNGPNAGQPVTRIIDGNTMQLRGEVPKAPTGKALTFSYRDTVNAKGQPVTQHIGTDQQGNDTILSEAPRYVPPTKPDLVKVWSPTLNAEVYVPGHAGLVSPLPPKPPEQQTAELPSGAKVRVSAPAGAPIELTPPTGGLLDRFENWVSPSPDATPTPPKNPRLGQLWESSNPKTPGLYRWDGTNWDDGKP